MFPVLHLVCVLIKNITPQSTAEILSHTVSKYILYLINNPHFGELYIRTCRPTFQIELQLNSFYFYSQPTMYDRCTDQKRRVIASSISFRIVQTVPKLFYLVATFCLPN